MIGERMAGLLEIAILLVSIAMVAILLIRRKRNKKADELYYLFVFIAFTLGSFINMIPAAHCFPELYYSNTFLVINILVVIIACYCLIRGLRLSYKGKRNNSS